jgi:hypothetical protein
MYPDNEANKSTSHNELKPRILMPFHIEHRAVLTLWHAYFLGLWFFPLFFFLLGGLHCFLFLNFSH